MKTSGIYKIVNKVNGKYCVGSSSNITERWGQHRRALQRNIHWNDKLQMGWNKYKEENFEFIIVEQCNPDKETLLGCEQKYLDIAKSNKKMCYNITFTAGKVDMTPEVREKMSKAKLGKYDGNKNPAYKHISKKIEQELKAIWVEGGKNKVAAYAKEKYNIGEGIICQRLIPKYRLDKKAVAKRKENYSLLASNLMRKHCIFSGKENNRFNPKIYHFTRNDGEKFSGTLHDFRNKYGFYPRNDLLCGKRKTNKGWSLVSPKAVVGIYSGIVGTTQASFTDI